jgi:ATP-dependent Clp protease ATP-binding subunit ClpC
MTSNVGYEHFRKRSLGFNPNPDAAKEAVTDAVKKEFRPEFLNRIDDIIVFESLTREDCRQILDLEVEKIRQRTKYTTLSLSQPLKEKILREGFSDEYGARQLKRTLEHLLTDPISDALLRQEIAGTGDILADYYAENGVVIREAGPEPRKTAAREPVPAGVRHG